MCGAAPFRYSATAFGAPLAGVGTAMAARFTQSITETCDEGLGRL
jgi:hypothetical protein